MIGSKRTIVLKRKCVICGYDRPRVHIKFRRGPVVKCRNCGLVYACYENEKTLVGDYYGRVNIYREIAYYHDLRIRYFRRALKTIEELRNKPGIVLDIGSSFGWFLELASRSGWEIKGIEPSNVAADYSKEIYGLDIIQGHFKDIDLPTHSLDIVTMWNVFEHFEDPLDSLVKINRALRKDGLTVMACPNVDGLITRLVSIAYKLSSGKIDRPARTLYLCDSSYPHLFHFSPRTLSLMLEKTGFTVEVIQGQDIVDVNKLKLRTTLYESDAWADNILIAFAVRFLLFSSKILKMSDEFVLYARKIYDV